MLGKGFDHARGHFVRVDGASELDASLLILPLVRFIPANDPRKAGTVAAIERELMSWGLVRRMAATGDGHDGGAFLACSCWLADCLKPQGRGEAASLLEDVMSVANDVGLLSEEFHVPTQQLIGNFPQAHASRRGEHRAVSVRTDASTMTNRRIAAHRPASTLDLTERQARRRGARSFRPEL